MATASKEPDSRMQATPRTATRQHRRSVESGACARPRGSVVDLFCGAGGLSHGFLREGFDVRAGVDTDSACRYAYERNNRARFVERDVGGLSAAAVDALFAPGRPRVLVGCAPCQPFSAYSQNPGDAKWRLLGQFGRLVAELAPDVVSMENVPRLTTFHGGRVFQDFLDTLAQADYRHVWWDTVDCLGYGVPQRRQRLVVLASRVGPIRLEEPSRSPDTPATVRDAIGDRPPIPAGGQHPDDALHRASRLSATNLRRIRDAKPGGTWRDWSDPALRARCHRRRSGRWYGSVYGRMAWDDAAPTLTTQCNGFGNGRFGHPEQDRAISLREAALLQSFPADYAFVEPGKPWSITGAARMIGNAVPVNLARAIARSVATTLDAADA